MILKRKILIIVLLSAAFILSAAAAGSTPKAPSVHNGIQVVPGVNATQNAIQNSTANATHPVQNPEFSEINMNISAYYQPLQLYVTAPQGTPAPMLQKFNATLRAPGDSSYVITDSALQGGSDVYAQGSFYYNTTVSLDLKNSGQTYVIFTITSSQLRHSLNFTYIFEFYTPVDYINYEHNKLTQHASLTWSQAGEIAGGALFLGWLFVRVFLPIARDYIRKSNRKGGMILLAKN